MPRPRRHGDVGEGAVPVVVEETVGAGVVRGGVRAVLRTPVDEDVEVGEAVAVVVEGDGRGAPVGEGDPCRRPDLLERPVSAVVEEEVRAVEIGDVEVLPPVVVVIEGERADRFLPGRPLHAHPLGDLLERAVAPVVEEEVPGPARDEEVLPSVSVEVEDRDPGGEVLAGNRHVPRGAGADRLVDGPFQPRGLGPVLVQGPGGHGRPPGGLPDRLDVPAPVAPHGRRLPQAGLLPAARRRGALEEWPEDHQPVGSAPPKADHADLPARQGGEGRSREGAQGVGELLLAGERNRGGTLDDLEGPEVPPPGGGPRHDPDPGDPGVGDARSRSDRGFEPGRDVRDHAVGVVVERRVP